MTDWRTPSSALDGHPIKRYARTPAGELWYRGDVESWAPWWRRWFRR